jgi:tetratricopeptide (TPR) repeat protein
MRRTGARTPLLAVFIAFIPLLGRADSRSQKYYYEDISHPFFALDPARPGWYKSDRPAAVRSSFPAAKAPNTFRVFVIGGSIASLLHFEDGPGDLGPALQGVLPGMKVEVLNCGMAGYETYREALIEQEILEYSPDLIVFLTGHNEGIASSPIPIWIMKTQERLSRLSAYRALVKTFQPDDKPHDDARADARDETFARNLGENLRHARERGVPVAVVVPPRNYRAPVEKDGNSYDAVSLPGWISFLRGDYAAARKLWKESLTAKLSAGTAPSDHNAFTWGWIARSEEKLGLADEARASFDKAAAFDRAAVCGARCQGIIRGAVAKEGGFLVEADRMFRALALPRAPGMETFNDRMHWKPRFNCLMSSEIIASVRANSKLGKTLAWDDARVKALNASCEKPGGPGDARDDLRILSYVLMGLSWTNFSRLSTVSVFYLEAIRTHQPGWFADVSKLMKLSENPQTQIYGIVMAPDAQVLPRFHWHIGETRMLEKDYAGAAADFAKALELDPKLSWVRVSLAIAEALRGDKKRASALLKEAGEMSKDDPRRDLLIASAVAVDAAFKLGGADAVAGTDPDHWLAKAAAALEAGNKREGMEALGRAVSASPRPDQLRIAGQSYRLFHEDAEFLKLSDALTAAFPRDGDLWLMIAEASYSEGRKDLGAAALERALKLEPNAAQSRMIADLRLRFESGR